MDKQFKKVRAIFKPAKEHEHTIAEEYRQFIGREFVFQYLYIMDEESGDPFPGVWALTPVHYGKFEFMVGWVPEFDLEILEELNV